MRFGMSGCFLPANMDDFTDETAARVRTLGFSGVFTRFLANDPFTTTPQQCRRVRAILEAHGLHLYQLLGYRPLLIAPDDAVRRGAVHRLQAAIRIGHYLGARGVHTGPGSLNPQGAWFPHPYNWTQRAREQLVKSLRECAAAAADYGVLVALEGHVLVTLSSAEAMREVLDAVDSPWIRCDLDAVNWITLDAIFDTGSAVRHMVNVLGTHIIGGHAKDVVIEDRLVTHISQRPPGQGLLDYRTLLPLLEALDPDLPLVTEGCEEADLPQTSAFLHQTARELGITVRG